MFKHQCVYLSHAALLSGLCAGAARAESSVPNEVLMRMAPQQQEAYIKTQIARRQARRAAAPAAPALDATPHVFPGFNAGPLLNLQRAQPLFKVLIAATDDLSGVTSVSYGAQGPSGQTLNGFLQLGFPTKTLTGIGGLQIQTRLLEPGVWSFSDAFLCDLAGNGVFYDQSALAALGNTTFTVAKTKGYDAVPPALISGTVLSPVVSLSSHAVGTDTQPPFVRVSMKATDTGSTFVAGVQSAQTFFYIADHSACLYAYAQVSVVGQSSVTLDYG